MDEIFNEETGTWETVYETYDIYQLKLKVRITVEKGIIPIKRTGDLYVALLSDEEILWRERQGETPEEYIVSYARARDLVFPIEVPYQEEIVIIRDLALGKTQKVPKSWNVFALAKVGYFTDYKKVSFTV